MEKDKKNKILELKKEIKELEVNIRDLSYYIEVLSKYKNKDIDDAISSLEYAQFDYHLAIDDLRAQIYTLESESE